MMFSRYKSLPRSRLAPYCGRASIRVISLKTGLHFLLQRPITEAVAENRSEASHSEPSLIALCPLRPS